MKIVKKPFKKMMSQVILLGGLSINSAFAGQLEINQVEQAVNTLDDTRLIQLADEYQGYDLALLYYRLSMVKTLKGDQPQALTALDDAEVVLAKLEAAQPNNAEVKALLAQVYGVRIGLEPMKSMIYGPKSYRKIAQAEALEQNNPRVFLVKAIAKFHTPVAFGGGLAFALTAIEQAIEKYPSDLNSGYHWGFAEALTWKGVIYQKMGNNAEAEQSWNQALDVDPSYGWAQQLLKSPASF